MKTAKTEKELEQIASPYILAGYEITTYTRYIVALSKGGETIYISRV